MSRGEVERNYAPSVTSALYCGWVVNPMHRSLYCREYLVPAAQGRSGRVQKISPPLGDSLILNIHFVDAQFLACMRLEMYTNYSRSTSSLQLSRKTVFFFLPKNMTTRVVQYLRWKTDELSLG
jgi:hypothetical protein